MSFIGLSLLPTGNTKYKELKACLPSHLIQCSHKTERDLMPVSFVAQLQAPIKDRLYVTFSDLLRLIFMQQQTPNLFV